MLDVKNLSFSYNKNTVLNNLSFTVNAGECIAVIGESGSGKSTLLKTLRGEYDLNNGEIFWNNTQILGPKFNLVIGYDFIKYVAQEFELMPFISVAENIGKHLSNFYKKEKKERVDQLINVVELNAFANTKVKLLSGGQKQRVALARALAKKPEILLLDEPFSHIDNFKKQSLRRNVFKYLKENNIACVMATHDKEDVLGFADRLLVLNNKSIEENSTPKALFENPKTPLIASFFGEFNVINKKIIYAHQIKVVEVSNIRALVLKNYFKGNHYLIEAVLNDETILFEHDTALEIQKEVCLKTE